jgi:hypothetical protein
MKQSAQDSATAFPKNGLNFRHQMIDGKQEQDSDMKKPAALFSLFNTFALALLIGVTSGCKTTSETERPQVFTVMNLSGAARYRIGESNAWCTVKLGVHLPQNSVIRTADGLENFVTLAVGKHLAPTMAIDPRPDVKASKLILYENSTLKINKITSITAGGTNIWDIRANFKTCRWLTAAGEYGG